MRLNLVENPKAPPLVATRAKHKAFFPKLAGLYEDRPWLDCWERGRILWSEQGWFCLIFISRPCPMSQCRKIKNVTFCKCNAKCCVLPSYSSCRARVRRSTRCSRSNWLALPHPCLTLPDPCVTLTWPLRGPCPTLALALPDSCLVNQTHKTKITTRVRQRGACSQGNACSSCSSHSPAQGRPPACVMAGVNTHGLVGVIQGNIG